MLYARACVRIDVRIVSMTHPGTSFRPDIPVDFRTISFKAVLLVAAALIAICALDIWLSFALSSMAESAELTEPRQLQPRYTAESNSAPARGKRVNSPQLISTMTVAQCGHLRSPGERQGCMVRASGGPWSYAPSATINGAATVIVGGNN
jgi:hypothetical protein